MSSNVISMSPVTARREPSSSTYGNLALVAMMPISFALIVLLIVAFR